MTVIELFDTLTLTEAAEVLGLSTSTLRRQIGRGRLTAHKRGQAWFVTRTEVERYRAEHKGRTGQALS